MKLISDHLEQGLDIDLFSLQLDFADLQLAEAEHIVHNLREMSARVEVITQKGDKLVEYVETPSGDPRKPMSREEIQRKFYSQATHVLRKADTAKAIKMINELDNLNDISELMTVVSGK